MYLTFYNLTKQPFNITPDPKFLYLSPSHKEALAAIIYGIEQKKGFIAIIGAVGVGKTTILRAYLQTAEKKRLKIVYVFNARLTFEELLKTVHRELGLSIESDKATDLADRLYQFLIEEYEHGNTVVLIIDEAQNMPVETLESLRMLSNFETPNEKLIQIVLVGQPEFEERLNTDRLRPLKQRLAIRSTILPLTKKESLEYVRSRLQKAGCYPGSVFAASALKKVVKSAQGIPRLLNVFCDNALITGFGYRQKPVTKKIVSEVIGDLEGSRVSSLTRWSITGTLALALLVVGVVSILPREEALLRLLGRAGGAPLSREQSPPGDTARQARSSGSPAAWAGEVRQTEAKGPVQLPSFQTNKPPALTRTITRGDNLSKLAQEVYGYTNDEIIKLIRKDNPQITDPDIIVAGSSIVFPNAQGQAKSGNRRDPLNPRPGEVQ